MLKSLSIKLKLTLITATSSLIALALAAFGFLYLDLASYKTQAVQDITTEMRVLGLNCGQALKKKDSPDAEKVLSAFQAQPQIDAASVYTPDGHLFASYTREGVVRSTLPYQAEMDGYRFAGNKIQVFHTIKVDGKTVGVLFVQAGLQQWYERRDRYAGFTLWLVLFCLAAALLASSAMQGVISKPIHELAHTMRLVAADEQYGHRAVKRSDDEIGQLVDGFNSMLSEIAKRDRELHEANQKLEDRVKRRTQQLQLEIDQRREAQEELLKSQHSLNDFFENATVGLHWLAVDGTVLKVNDAELQMLGYSHDEYVGQNIAAFHADPSEIRDMLQRLRNREVLRGFEVRMRRKDGQIKHVEVDANVLWENGKFGHARCFVRDLTAQKEAEMATLAREQAERANYAKSEFLSRMSHELRTPMNSILGFGQLLQMEELTPDQQDSVQQIIGAGSHLLRLINEVLDISRIESGHLAISKEAVPVQDVFQEVASLVHPLAAQKRVVLITSVADAEGRHVMADRQRLCQVLLNLVSNAIKYHNEGGEVRLEIEERDDILRLRVVDNGNGIPKDKINSLFVPFERLGAENTTIEGTGLGLALSKRLTEAMGGTIGMEDVPKGASFYVDLPEAGSPLQVLDTPEWSQVSEPVATTGESKTILLVEDNLSNVKLVEKILSSRPGIRLITAMQGTIALELAREHMPDLILLDLNLPDIHGEQVLRRLQDESVTRGIPVAVVSADATPTQIERLKDSGAIAYLTKPLDIRAFRDLLDEALGLTLVKKSA